MHLYISLYCGKPTGSQSRGQTAEDSSNRIQSSASKGLSYQKLSDLTLFPLLLAVHQSNFCFVHIKLFLIAIKG